MAIDERRRSELYEGLAGAIGAEAAVTMFELLPPHDTELATRADLDQLEARMDLRFAAVDHRFDALEQRLGGRIDTVDQRVDGLEQRMDDRFDALEHRIDDRIDGLRGELLAAFRSELVTAVSGQTRAVIVATAAATFAIGGLAVTLAQLL